MMDEELSKLLSSSWTPNESGLSEQDVQNLNNTLPANMPPMMASLYRTGNGAHLVSDIYLADSSDFLYFNEDVTWREAFPGAIFFGFDEGGGVFFVDTSDQLSCMSGGIFWCDRSAMEPGSCLRYGASFEQFLRNILNGVDPRLEI